MKIATVIIICNLIIYFRNIVDRKIIKYNISVSFHYEILFHFIININNNIKYVDLDAGT